MEHKKLKTHQAIIKKALEDEVFKRNLIASPQKTLTSNGFKIVNPDNVKFEVVDQLDPDKIFINIPPAPLNSDMELSDEQLELVAGGSYSEGGGCNIYVEIEYDDMTICIEKHT